MKYYELVNRNQVIDRLRIFEDGSGEQIHFFENTQRKRITAIEDAEKYMRDQEFFGRWVGYEWEKCNVFKDT